MVCPLQKKEKRILPFVAVIISPLYRTDAKPRAEAACRLCRGAKEEEQRSKGVWGIGNTSLSRYKKKRNEYTLLQQ